MGRWFWVFLLSLVCLGGICQTVVKRSGSTIALEGKRYYMHTVSPRETLFAICKAYGVSEKSVEERNPFITSGLRKGQLLFIPIITPQTDNAAAESSSTSPTHDVPIAVIAPPVMSNDPHSDTDTVADSSSVWEQTPLGLTAQVDQNSTLNVALMLPFGGTDDVTFVDFYRGAVIAIEELRGRGIDVKLKVLSTGSSAQTVRDIIDRGELNRANLIIGPVYDEPFQEAASYATMRRIPIISPLAPVSANPSPFIVEVAPVDSNKWSKAATIISNPDNNVVVVDYGDNNDSMVMVELSSIVPYGTPKLEYSGKATHINTITNILSRDRHNVIILPSSNENAVEGFLARLSSINSTSRYKITVVGTSRWGRFSTLDFELFFKLGVIYPSSYHADRSNGKVSRFYNTYITQFSDLPSLFAFRGYDVAKGFISLIADHGQRALIELNTYDAELLQMPYLFEQKDEFDKFANTSWGLVTYKPDFTISIL